MDLPKPKDVAQAFHERFDALKKHLDGMPVNQILPGTIELVRDVHKATDEYVAKLKAEVEEFRALASKGKKKPESNPATEETD